MKVNSQDVLSSDFSRDAFSSIGALFLPMHEPKRPSRTCLPFELGDSELVSFNGIWDERLKQELTNSKRLKHRQGCSIFVFNYSGFGRSQGHPSPGAWTPFGRVSGAVVRAGHWGWRFGGAETAWRAGHEMCSPSGLHEREKADMRAWRSEHGRSRWRIWKSSIGPVCEQERNLKDRPEESEIRWDPLPETHMFSYGT